MTNQTNSVSRILSFGKVELKKSEIDSYSLDATLLLMAAADITKIEVLTNSEKILSTGIVEKYIDYIEKRKLNMPVQYILNKCEFMSLDFYVDKNVLIPRPDTEILTEYAIEQIKNNGFKNILEIGTGSGCISISMAHYLEDINIVASDISREALDISIKNASKNNVLNKISFVQSDLFKNLDKQNFDLIISNPPYIKNKVIDTLSENVRKYEPYHALFGGWDGLFFYESIIKSARDYLKPEGMIMFEIGYDQGDEVLGILRENKFEKIQIIKDLAGLDRVVMGMNF